MFITAIYESNRSDSFRDCLGYLCRSTEVDGNYPIVCIDPRDADIYPNPDVAKDLGQEWCDKNNEPDSTLSFRVLFAKDVIEFWTWRN